MGEGEFAEKTLVAAVRGALVEAAEPTAELRVSTPGGRFQVRWDGTTDQLPSYDSKLCMT